MPEAWLFMLGGLFIAVTLFLPRGIVGTIEDQFAKRKRRLAAETEGTLTARTAP